jgi:ketosteroid isomerase-like protein
MRKPTSGVESTRRSRQSAGYWVRWTTGWRKIDGDWRIVHYQISVPVDFANGKALLNLQP